MQDLLDFLSGKTVISSEELLRAGVPKEAIQQRRRAKELYTIRRGIYTPYLSWQRMSPEQQHLVRVQAANQAISRPLVFSHRSASVIHGLPIVGPSSSTVHVLEPRALGTGGYTGIHFHRDHYDEEMVIHNGLQATSLARTLVDVARTNPIQLSVPVLDFAIRLEQSRNQTDPSLYKALLRQKLGGFAKGKHGKSRALTAIAECTTLSDSVGESISRMFMLKLGFAPPVLQQSFTGLPYRVDFWWPQTQVIGEFDGASKYLKDNLRNGLSPAEVVYREKLREDELRQHCKKLIRWDSATASNPQKFARLLDGAGVPRA